MKIVGSTGLCGLWALEWAWHIRVTNLRKKLRNLHAKFLFYSLCCFRDLGVHTDGRTDGHG